MPTTPRSHAAASLQIRRRLARLTPPPLASPVAAGPAEEPDADPPPPAVTVSARVDTGRAGLLLLCVVAVLAAGLSALLTWAGRPDPTPLPIAAVPAGAAASDGGTSDGGTLDGAASDGAAGRPPPFASPPPAAPGSPTTVVVAVVGQVVTPGLVTLPLGSRVADAVAAAGGARPDADLSTVNLARVLIDGEQVAVGVPGAPPVAGGPATPGVPALVDLNTATETQLEELPGVGPVLAGRITAYREEHGGFSSVEELQEVSGIGPSTYADLQDAVTV